MASTKQSIYGYRVAENGEFIRIADGRESRTDFFYVRGGRADN